MLSTFITIWLLHVAALITPGPNVLLVSQLAASGNRSGASYAAVGIAIGAAIWSFAAVLGVGAMFAAFPATRLFLQVAGATYLLYVSIRLWRSRARAARLHGALCESFGLMNTLVHIRRYREGEEPALFEIYYSAIHLVACQNYTPEQLQAWAPRDLDSELWRSKIRGISPFVAELDGQIVGYADLQPNGYIDHFFVSGTRPREGIGSQLMRHLFDQAQALGIFELTSDVSRTAQPFYKRFGFSVVERRRPEVRGVVVPNAFMRRTHNET